MKSLTKKIINKNIFFYKKCSSTNLIAVDMIKNNAPIKEGTIIYTENQYDGKGQANSSWISEPNKNLTFSIIMFPSFIASHETFTLNIIASLSIFDSLKKYIDSSLYIKWPNDIFLNNKKIGGILIENIIRNKKIQNSVIGIGLNVNQEKFSIKNASSIYLETKTKLSLASLLQDIIDNFDNYYNELKNNKDIIKNYKKKYINKLYWYDEYRTFFAKKNYFVGKIIDISDFGYLIIKTKTNEILKFFYKEIVYVH